ncbi:hypothetical protein T484DRAFT_1646993, partial [Baffinella frigidus]
PKPPAPEPPPQCSAEHRTSLPSLPPPHPPPAFKRHTRSIQHTTNNLTPTNGSGPLTTTPSNTGKNRRHHNPTIHPNGQSPFHASPRRHFRLQSPTSTDQNTSQHTCNPLIQFKTPASTNHPEPTDLTLTNTPLLNLKHTAAKPQP